MNRWLMGVVVAVNCLAACVAAAAPERGEFRRSATLRVLPLDQVRDQALSWLESQQGGAAALTDAESIWRASGSADALDRLAATASLVDMRAATLVERCSRGRSGIELVDDAWLFETATDRFVAANLRLYHARWLAQERLYDEAQSRLTGIAPADVIDPAALLFYRAVVDHQLLNIDQALDSLARLSTDVVDAPARYTALATLMRGDLAGISDQPIDDGQPRDETVRKLDKIARRMSDVRRRLELGRAGQTVRDIEDGVVKSLDELIKELEERQKQSQAASASAQLRPSRPMEDSRPAGGRGPGETDPKNFGDTSAWGDLPDRERDEAMQQIGKDFPAHYREAIEQYFRSLAEEVPE